VGPTGGGVDLEGSAGGTDAGSSDAGLIGSPPLA
jgi:hypothetical protein